MITFDSLSIAPLDESKKYSLQSYRLEDLRGCDVILAPEIETHVGAHDVARA
jgi:hypothetical protein